MEKTYTQEDLNRAFETGKSLNKIHNFPSPETRERLATLETNQNNFMTELQEIKSMIKELDGKISCALEKKADKWVEQVLIWVGITIVGVAITIIGFLINQIFFSK
jgi:hypothetical protein